MAKFLASLDPDMPWHISRFHPDNKMRDFPSTPMSSIDRARSIGKDAGVRFIYSGNVWGDQGEHTRCPACNKVIIERFGFNVVSNRLQEGMCPYCKEEIKGIWS
jgi:pyruvate formate lyase activating enzyme